MTNKYRGTKQSAGGTHTQRNAAFAVAALLILALPLIL